MSYAIYRHKKMAQMGSIAASAGHMMRTRPTPNADPARAGQNRILIGSDDPVADVRAILPDTDARGADGKLLRRKNSVLAIEVLLTASPEWWTDASKEQKRDWLESTTEWLVQEYGRENIAHLQLHQDEATPHLTGLIVPRDPDTGRLNARRWIGGSKLCSQQQSDYAETVKHLGLKRGVEGSEAKHERVKRHYAAVNQKPPKIEVDKPPRILLDPEGWAKDQTKKIQKQTRTLSAQASVANRDRKTAKAAKITANKAVNRAKKAEKTITAKKEQANQLRALPLPDVLDALGFALDPKDPTKWKTEGFSIGIKDGKWYDYKAQKGRGGAIDLVCHVMETDFNGALSWLADRFGGDEAAADLAAHRVSTAKAEIETAVKERPPFTPPEPVPANWSRVRQFLNVIRGIPTETIDQLHEQGDLYADKRQNAVFLARNARGEVTGAELKGTRGKGWSGMSPGSTKAAGGFQIGTAVAVAKAVYWVESAIDAISLYVLKRREKPESSICVVSAAGALPTPSEGLDHALHPQALRFCGYDADEAGDHAAKKLSDYGFMRERPIKGKDWNDQLRAPKDDDTGPGNDHGGPRLG